MELRLSNFWVGEKGRIYDEYGGKVWGIGEDGFLSGDFELDKIKKGWIPF